MSSLESIENLALIENNLLHIEFELDRGSPSFLRASSEAHLALYRAMIEALKGSANLAVLGALKKNRCYQYQRGSMPWRQIQKPPGKTSRKAWRFTQPVSCPPPNTPKVHPATLQQSASDEWLIGFYDALAMIQTECFMLSFVHSRVVEISDDEMATLEWLHEQVRNEIEHFVPKHYTAFVPDLVRASEICLRLTRELLFCSGNVIFRDESGQRLEQLLNTIDKHLRQHGQLNEKRAEPVAETAPGPRPPSSPPRSSTMSRW
jgi:hypothetical protein